MNGQTEFAYRVRRVLNRGAESLDGGIADRIYAARQHALARQRVATGALGVVGGGNFTADLMSSTLRPFLAAAALVIGVTGAYVWNRYDQAVSYAEIDSEILADDVPFNAYLDQGFMEWLNRRAQEADEDTSSSSP